MLRPVHIGGQGSSFGTITRTGLPLSKTGPKEAYRAVPVHPSDQCLLAVSWNGTTYLDRALPFGLRSAPKLFSALTDAVMWFLHDRGVHSALHYLDDFLVMGPPGQNSCAEALATTLALCEELGFPVAPEKTEGPATTLTFLGIEIDTEKLQLRLPQVKLSQLAATIAGWMRVADHPTARHSGKKRELLSLLGLLNHAAMEVRPGRAFMRNLIDASSTVKDLDHWVHLNQAAQADLTWWHTFLQAWNGTSIMPPTTPPLVVVSDASGSWGCGAAHENLWFQLQWPETWAAVSIAPNMAVVAAVNKGAARDPTLSHLLRILAFVVAVLDLQVSARHLPRLQNSSADALSRDRPPLFLSLNPQASPVPTIIPSELQPVWTALLSTSWIPALRLPPAQRIDQDSAAMQLSANDTL